MRAFWRYPSLPIGVVLLVLGVGNSMVSYNKLIEYERRTRAPEASEPTSSLEGYTRLTERTNATLLERLHRRPRDYGVVDARHDFYTVVQSGGRLIAAFGVLLIGAGLLRRWRERRLRGVGEVPSMTPPAATGR
jgi:hypothetical protein